MLLLLRLPDHRSLSLVGSIATCLTLPSFPHRLHEHVGAFDLMNASAGEIEHFILQLFMEADVDQSGEFDWLASSCALVRKRPCCCISCTAVCNDDQFCLVIIQQSLHDRSSMLVHIGTHA